MIDKLILFEDRKFQKLDTKVGNAVFSAPEDKTPFFILLHNLGKNENYISKFGSLLPKNSFILSIRGKFDWKVDGEDSFAWFDINGPYFEIFCKEEDILKSAEHINEIISETKKQFPNLDEPIIIGFSQGGVVALTIAVENLFDVKAVYSHCGFYEPKLNTNKTNIQTPILVTNGERDTIIPIDWYNKTKENLNSKCKNFDSYLIECGHEMNEKAHYLFSIWLKSLLKF